MGGEARLITFEQARSIVQEQLSGEWPAEAGFTTAPWGWETSTAYVVLSGPASKILPPRTAKRNHDDELNVCVDKETGEITYEELSRTPLTPCGSGAP